MNWEEIFDSLADNDYVVVDDFFPKNLYHSLNCFLHELSDADRLRKAGIGTQQNFQVIESIRGDNIFWLDPAIKVPAIQDFFQKMEELKSDLNRNFFLSLSGYEFHFAHYPPGSFYKRHSDQFAGRNNRLITVIFYFNDEWKPGDGGELNVFLENEEKQLAPLGNRMLMFRSEKIEHEVLATHTDRYSLTGWMLYQPPGLTFL
ncbi:MAG TPA: 2OG-Fe(II) oxygenase [Bacteroidales bacterium]